MHNIDEIQHCIDVLLQKSSFVKAAQELYISQPYLTQLIRKIEKKLGTKILDRHKTPYQLTDAGLIYYHYLETISNEKQQLKKELSAYVNPNKEVIKIGVLESLGSYLLPEILPDFLEKNPDVEIQLFEAIPRISERRLLNGEIDCYMGQTPEAIDSSLSVVAKGGESYYVVISPKSKYYQKGKFILRPGELNLKKLLKQPMVLSATGSAIRHQVNGLFQRLQLRENIAMESSSIITATGLAIHGAGLTISSPSIIKRMAETPINLLPIDPKLINITFFIAFRHDQRLTPGLVKLIKLFKSKNLQPSIY